MNFDPLPNTRCPLCLQPFETGEHIVRPLPAHKGTVVHYDCIQNQEQARRLIEEVDKDNTLLTLNLDYLMGAG